LYICIARASKTNKKGIHNEELLYAVDDGLYDCVFDVDITATTSVDINSLIVTI
jgi:hypothetical protein